MTHMQKFILLGLTYGVCSIVMTIGLIVACAVALRWALS